MADTIHPAHTNVFHIIYHRRIQDFVGGGGQGRMKKHSVEAIFSQDVAKEGR